MSLIQLLVKFVMEKSAALGIILVIMIILASLYYEFHDRCNRYVEDHPGIIMAVILLLIFVLLLVFGVLLTQTDSPINIISDKNLDARITNKVDEAMDKKKAEDIGGFAVFAIICAAGCLLVCSCIGCIATVRIVFKD